MIVRSDGSREDASIADMVDWLRDHARELLTLLELEPTAERIATVCLFWQRDVGATCPSDCVHSNECNKRDAEWVAKWTQSA